ncbi:hypothetical protein GBF38_020871 [Nibea albiflora]|uniref:Uncharacterized protein n=1 Tax=Nibea albiflora TaxID=240163 RepID=A0ACB7FF97_NIBAL|nr:hypothetical protein GBF38_020871 [Nibea albiflora]
MVEFWIQVSSFLILLLHFTAAETGQSVFYVVRAGDEVTLACANVTGDQDKCEHTAWVFSAPRHDGTVLFVNGQIVEEAKSKSDRLSVTQNCSLVIKNVTDEDVGRYTCRQFKSTHGDSLVYLFIVTMTEHENNDEVTLSCSVSEHRWCYHSVEWLYEGGYGDVLVLERSCSVNLTYKKQESKKYKSFHCEVTDPGTERVQQFPFSPQTSGEKPARADCSVLDYIMLVMRVAELLLITVITVLLIRARGNQRPPEGNTVNNDEDEDDGVVTYEN